MFREVVFILSYDSSVVNVYLTNLRHRLSFKKTARSVFHLKNCSAHFQLNVKVQSIATVKFNPHPSYLRHMPGSFSVFKDTLIHKKKVSSQVALNKQLASVGWGAA